METRFYAHFYEEVMRPRLTRAVTRRTLQEEYALSSDWLDLRPGVRLLDVACGTGNFTRYFARRQPDAGLIVGADLSWSMLDEARGFLARDGLDAQIALARLDAIQMPIASESYDRVHCHAALHFMDDPDAALRSFQRVLRPDGLLVVGTFLQSRDPFRRLTKRVSSLFSGFRWFEKEDLRRRLERAGFVCERESVEGDAITLRCRKRA